MFFLLHLRSIWRCFYTFSSNVLHFTPSSSVYKSTLHPNLLLRESFTHVGICSILFLITLGLLLPSSEPHISSSHFQQAIILHPLSYHTIPAFLCNASSVPSFKVSVITPCLHFPLLHQEQGTCDFHQGYPFEKRELSKDRRQKQVGAGQLETVCSSGGTQNPLRTAEELKRIRLSGKQLEFLDWQHTFNSIQLN